MAQNKLFDDSREHDLFYDLSAIIKRIIDIKSKLVMAISDYIFTPIRRVIERRRTK